ncbi:MAG: hypothetical protein L6V93_16320 [Clostridiales bacterium]|nr:MAG: hypothetical protein L6V93_16320 [Clostridiales bacterium]
MEKVELLAPAGSLAKLKICACLRRGRGLYRRRGIFASRCGKKFHRGRNKKRA